MRFAAGRVRTVSRAREARFVGARAAYQDLFEELFNSQEWQDYCKSDGLTCDKWITGDELAAFHEAQLKRHVELIETVGAESITSK